MTLLGGYTTENHVNYTCMCKKNWNYDEKDLES